MAISAEEVKALRDQTGVSVMECKAALEEAQGNMAAALKILGARAVASAQKKAGRSLGAGTVAAYIHAGGQIGAMVLLSCETDFVSKNEEFILLGRDIAMHAAAMRPESEAAMLAEPFIKDTGKTIADLLTQATQKFGERTEVSRMTYFSVK